MSEDIRELRLKFEQVRQLLHDAKAPLEDRIRARDDLYSLQRKVGALGKRSGELDQVQLAALARDIEASSYRVKT